jgi:hypothetical protein
MIVDSDWGVSRYRVGEWLVDVFCLIPIHIAVCRENRFVPLADGVLSSDLERNLLGAEVNTIVDKLSFGWYESIFQSYMATKVTSSHHAGVCPLVLKSTLTDCKGGVIHGSAIRGQELRIESSSGYIVCRKRHADNRYVRDRHHESHKEMMGTEGVWMSVTPTDDELIVALDFEGQFDYFLPGHIWYSPPNYSC